MPPLRKPTGFWGDPDEIRSELTTTTDKRLTIRLTSMLLLSEGGRQKDVAQELGVSVATLRIWVKRWNTNGLAGLRSRHRGSKRYHAEFLQGMQERGFLLQRLSSRFSAWIPQPTGPLFAIEKQRSELAEPEIFRSAR